MYFVKVSLFSSLISSAITPPLLVMMIESNIDAERFFTYVLPTFIPLATSIFVSFYLLYPFIFFAGLFFVQQANIHMNEYNIWCIQP
jgi:hypothetical protein